MIAITGGKKSPLAPGRQLRTGYRRRARSLPDGAGAHLQRGQRLMMGDALAMALMRQRGFNAEDFARSHPGGSLGARPVEPRASLMRTGDRLPRVTKAPT